jgi:DNA (cytosine-5)-methyltransferase 1
MSNNKTLTLGSLFDGSGGFPLAGILAGVTPLWASEIEPFAIRVTTKNFPQMKHYGDVSAMNGGELPPVDIITFGSPCQDMSIAGKRAGLDGSRSNLFYEAIRIVKEMREKTNGEKPRFIVWENVPGAFSSNKGDDFKAVLEAVIGVKEPAAKVPAPEKKGWPNADYYVGDGWSIAYRVLDAQWWGVPQRRQRIFLVADFAGERAPEILFESEGLSGYSAESFRTWQRTAGNPEEGIGETGTGGADGAVGGLVLNDQGGNRMDVTNEVTCTLRAEAHHPPVVLDEPKACHINQRDAGIDLPGISGTLMATRNNQMQTFIAENEDKAPDPQAAGFCTEHSAKARGIGYEEETSPTLRAGVVPAAIALENHPTDSRVKMSEDGMVQTLTSRMGTGGNNVPLVMEGELPARTLKIRSGCDGGGKGALEQIEKSATLGCNNDQTVFVPYGICSKGSNSMMSDNPNSGFYEAKTARTLDQNGGRPDCAQGGIAVVAFAQNQRNEVRDLKDVAGALQAEPGMKQQTYVLQGSMIGRKDENGPQGDGINEDVSFTLNTIDHHAVVFCDGPNAVATPTYSSSKASFFTEASEEMANTLVATDYKDPPIVNAVDEPHYIVRRLTPTECARLQGFPDWWCSGIGIENPTDEDIAFWTDVWETHRKVMGTSKKPKSEKQIRKWLQNPHSDSAEYKLWGNGVCLPIVFFVLSGIVWAASKDQEPGKEE